MPDQPYLKPCPFCNHLPTRISRHQTWCVNKKCETHFGEMKRSVWNVRPAEDRKDTEIARLNGLLDENRKFIAGYGDHAEDSSWPHTAKEFRDHNASIDARRNKEGDDGLS